MANAEHLERFKQGVEEWNQWREHNSDVQPDLSNADLRLTNPSLANLCGAHLAYLREIKLSATDLSGINLSAANLNKVNLDRATLRGADLRGADLRGANLNEAILHKANLRGADLCGATLYGANLHKANLIGVNLNRVNLSEANLTGFNLSAANLSAANLGAAELRGTNLQEANLSGANLRDIDLSCAQALGASFDKSVFTGACLEDWNINSSTSFEDAICEYVYLKANQQERRPREGIFQPGEFAALFQQAVDTIDLIFKDGIDWQVFFQSLQSLRSQYADQDLVIQSIERKQGGAFVVRLGVPPEADKPAIESSAKELYETKLALMEQQYRTELHAKDREIAIYKQSSASMEEIAKLLASRPITVEANAVSENNASKYNLSNAQFAGGFAETVQGDQIGGIINNYGSSAEDITRLLTALRNQAQTFPTDQKDDALDVLDDLERDLAEDQPDQGRIGRRLKKLVALGAAIGTIASGAAAVSGDVSTFTGNVIELTEQLGIPIDQVQLPPSGTP